MAPVSDVRRVINQITINPEFEIKILEMLLNLSSELLAVLVLASSWISAYGNYLLIPIITAGAGWATNWLAIKMTFYPLRYVGRFPFGWQGVVPARTRKFATGLVDRTIGRIGGLEAMMDAVDVPEIKRYFIQHATPLVSEAVNELMREEKRVMWENMPSPTKKLVIHVVKKELFYGVDHLANDFEAQFERLLDLKELVLERCEKHPDLLNRMVFACASEELSFLIRSGAYFGLFFGIIQALVWFYLPHLWVLPLFGFIVGGITNWIALQLIFTPVNPVKVGSMKIQGLFLRRQDDISREFSRVFTEELVNAKEIVHYLLHGSKSERTMALLRCRISEIMEKKIAIQLLTQTAFGPGGYANLKDAALSKAIHYAEELVDDKGFNETQSQAMQGILQLKLAEQPSEEFQELIRPIFHEDEWILVAVGGMLGAAIGWAQLMWLFGEQIG